jgi:phosphoenolpyruvate carboxykinase (GTP)
MTTNKKLDKWVKDMAAMCRPESIHWCDGTQAEYDDLCRQMVASGMATPLNPEKRPGCFLFRSHPSDVARVENRTYIASASKDDAGPCCTEKNHDRAFHGLHEGPHHVRDTVFNGPDRFADIQDRR